MIVHKIERTASEIPKENKIVECYQKQLDALRKFDASGKLDGKIEEITFKMCNAIDAQLVWVNIYGSSDSIESSKHPKSH